MSSRRWLLAGVALVLASASGCRLFCDRYCEREYEHCDRIYHNRGCGAAPVACPPGCAPAPGVYTPQPFAAGSYYPCQP
jgi:hypothetical protein